ncbi:hypothetical protein HOD83_02935 [Candidatus Woesearchaeota archaeon]|jgi:hypothetical protein|nr:hypothetical protein [Candidatus Woesearchaeota archaeon]MBT4114073.1 hypothetical protein [Candidatus Woesearchaeota archaeon]MBT4248514.1 hypothetical protein [Candidatus Woesearchaeota archaeon]
MTTEFHRLEGIDVTDLSRLNKSNIEANLVQRVTQFMRGVDVQEEARAYIDKRTVTNRKGRSFDYIPKGSNGYTERVFEAQLMQAINQTSIFDEYFTSVRGIFTVLNDIRGINSDLNTQVFMSNTDGNILDKVLDLTSEKAQHVNRIIESAQQVRPFVADEVIESFASELQGKMGDLRSRLEVFRDTYCTGTKSDSKGDDNITNLVNQMSWCVDRMGIKSILADGTEAYTLQVGFMSDSFYSTYKLLRDKLDLLSKESVSADSRKNYLLATERAVFRNIGISKSIIKDTLKARGFKFEKIPWLNFKEIWIQSK